MGLKYPSDLDAWARWQANGNLLRKAKDSVRELQNRVRKPAQQEQASTVQGVLHSASEAPKALFILDSTTPTAMSSLIRPLRYMPEGSYAVWAPEDVSAHLPSANWQVQELVDQQIGFRLPHLTYVVALGHYMDRGNAGYRYAQSRSIRFVTVQHGLNTPYAPPLAPGTHLLAFSEADAQFWISGRTDVTYDVVGSQLFWEASKAAESQAPSIELDSRPIFLGQMHGAELPRHAYASAGYTFCKQNDARYRPHPSEKDKLSVLTHRLWAKMGIDVDSGEVPLSEVSAPVVSIFSTGVLEAAIRGVPSWVYHSNPPAWLEEFWDRYGMNRWGGEPTPAPVLPDIEPAQKIAHIITQSLEK